MATVTSVPGVYIEEDASPAMSVSSGMTAVPLFVARFTPLKPELAGVITRIGSWLDYTTLFDSNLSSSALVNVTSEPVVSGLVSKKMKKALSETAMMQLAAEEEGKYTYQIDGVKVLVPIVSVALRLYFQNGGGPCYLYPLEKVDDNDALTALPRLMDEVGEITLLTCLDTDANYRSAVYKALQGSLGQNKGYFLLADSPDGNKLSELSDSAHMALYYPNLVASSGMTVDDAHVAISGYKDESEHVVTTLAELRPFNTDLAEKIDEAVRRVLPSQLLIPPSPLMAGVYCKTDLERGVWKAPANVVLNGVSDVSIRITNEQQADLNLKGINVIRHFSDRGLVVWGSRTQKDDNNWRYIPVRRLFDAAERDIKKALQTMVFEPNSQPTWKWGLAVISNYLHGLWQQGALAGNKAEEAYFVRVGKGITMTQDEINQGKMIIQVGMAAVRPAEFIILKFTQDMSQ